jgi:hypothetical protein
VAVPKPVIGLAAVAALGVGGLILLMSGGEEDLATAEARAAPADEAAARPDLPEVFPPAEPPAIDSTDEPREIPQLRMADDPVYEEGVGEYLQYRRDDGAIVRDHREGAADREPSFGGLSDPRQLPPTAEQVRPQTVLAVRDALRPAVRRCANEHAPEAEVGSAVRARVTFTIAAQRLTVDDVSTASRGLADAGALEGCVASAARDLSLTIAGAEDVEGHPIDLPFRVGPAR